MDDEGDWRAELDRWLEPFLAELGHAARRTMCPHYVAGLIGLGERKSMQPMAARQDGLTTIACSISSRSGAGTMLRSLARCWRRRTAW